MRSGRPVCCMPGSVISRMRLAPYWARSKPISSQAPAPNFSGGAPHVNTDSSVGTGGTVMRGLRSGVVAAVAHGLELVDLLGVVAEDDRRVGLLGDTADLLDRRVELAHVVDDRRRRRGRAVAL